jgi:two-component sensor histidine kinase/sensor domain CHASE-containing protein
MRKKIVLVISLTLFAMFVISSFATRRIIFDSFSELERSNMMKDVERLLSAVNDDLQSLNATNGDWAEWDETALFMLGRNPTFISRNLTDVDDFVTLRVGIQVLVDVSSRVVFAKAIDLSNAVERSLPTGMNEYLARNQGLLHYQNGSSSFTGIAVLPECTLLLTSRPILDDHGLGPVRGTFLMGRFLDDAEVQRLAHRTFLSISFAPLGRSDTPADFTDAASQIAAGTLIPVVIRSDRLVSGYASFNDVSGETALIARVDAPREIMNQGVRSAGYLMFCLAFIGTVFGAVVMIYLERTIISRVHALSAGVLKIGTSGIMSMRLSTRGTDEIAYLGAAIDGMLNALERSTEELRGNEARHQAFLSAVSDMMFRLSTDGTVIDFRWPAGASLPPVPGDVIGTSWLDINARYPFIPSEIVHRTWKAFGECIDSHLPCMIDFRTVSEGMERFYTIHLVASGDAECTLFIRDVTAEKKAGDAQRKEILLKEIHHRVKNNLQVISSLLDLQARASGDAHTKALLDESRGRLRAMSLIHEKLYQVEAAAGVPMREYIGELVVQLRNSFLADPDAVETRVDAEAISLDMDLAVPCGLIIHELVSNALKYAFPDGKKGLVTVRMREEEGERLVLEVGDDGVGIPTVLDIGTPVTLGLRIVQVLSSQLRGVLSLDRRSGSLFTLAFPRT